ncbi:MAG: sulfatase [Verrucomicrobiales bacterium]|nr:sulfatase [Verrucomicrobiales bacterium]
MTLPKSTLVIVSILVLTLSAARAEPAKPNVLFIVSDDLNMHLACYGDKIVKTPNLDRLAARGVRFDRAYAQYPVCNPSRTSFLSGLHAETTHVMDQKTILRDSMPKVVYLPEHFHSNGYFTASIGKIQHLGHHDAHWDVEDGVRAGDSDDEGDTSAKPKRRRANPADRKKPGEPPYFVYRATENDDPANEDTAIAAKAVDVLQKHKDQPFFIAVGFHKPHVPHVAPKKYFDLYPLDKVELVNVPANDADDIPKVALNSKKNYQPDMPEKTKREIIASYLACVSYMDAQVGRVLDELDRLKLSDKTIVVFISDHGWHFGEHNWWAKASLFEESTHVPLIVAGPGINSGKTCARVVEYLDIYPTMSEFCGLPKPFQGEGKSFVPLLNNPEAQWNKVAYTCEHRGPTTGRTVRNERYRCTEWNDGKAGIELYDHDKDPMEYTNLAKQAGSKQALADMKALLHRDFADNQ